MKRWIPLLVAGCGRSEGALLKSDFAAEIDQGWVCQGWGQVGPPATGADVAPVLYAALDSGEQFRVQVQSRAGATTYTSSIDFADYFLVYVGASLIVDEGENKCDDVIVNASQRIDYVYRAIAGASFVVDEGDRIGLEVEGVVLRADNPLLDGEGAADWENLPEVDVDDGALPSFNVTET
jgi:hypothetical protein